VFFDFDSSKITDAGQKVIDEAVAAAKDYGAAKVVVTGYTDSAGPASYNLKLSEKRAKAVQDALVAQGIDAGKISAMSKGEEDPLVPTANGVREPQNRRTEIMIR
jgi:outer membrane protein OmpA-like peptidoglycan-associated protein